MTKSKEKITLSSNDLYIITRLLLEEIARKQDLLMYSRKQGNDDWEKFHKKDIQELESLYEKLR